MQCGAVAGGNEGHTDNITEQERGEFCSCSMSKLDKIATVLGRIFLTSCISKLASFSW